MSKPPTNVIAGYIEWLAAHDLARPSDRALQAIWDTLAGHIQDALLPRLTAAWLDGITLPAAGRQSLTASQPHGLPFGPDSAAWDTLQRRIPVGSGLSAADWAAVPRQLRNVAQFSARVASAQAMSAIQSRLEREAAWDTSTPSGREAFIRDMRQVMEQEGIGWETQGEGSITNPRANSRLGMIYDIQTQMARQSARYMQATTPERLAATPARELIRIEERHIKRDWHTRWIQAGGKLTAGRMIALVTAPVWFKLGPFGNPYPPFDYNSGMGVEDLLRSECDALGVTSPDWQPDIPPEVTIERQARASAEGIDPTMRKFLKGHFGDQIEFDADTVRWRAERATSRREADTLGARLIRGAPATVKAKHTLTAYQDRQTNEEINNALWAGVETGLTRALDAAFKNARTTAPALTYRAIPSELFPPQDALANIGKTVLQKGFTSTSFSRDVALEGYGTDQNVTLYEIYTPKGAKALYLNTVTGGKTRHGDELELLLARQTPFLIRSVRTETTPDSRTITHIKTEVTHGTE